ncbi:MAG: CapA family protein [Clostridia bacterium]|nr:CapA family protein [Clostridia bacterium]
MKNANKKDKFSSVIALVCILTVIVSTCCAYTLVGHFRPDITDNVEGYLSTLGQPQSTEPEVPKTYTARLMCVGDNIIHSAIYNQAKERGDGEGYDFSYVYKDVKKIISKSDFAMINQQTVLSKELTPSSYPLFCSPTAVGNAIYDLGFNVINHANKNVGDKGSDGAQDTIEFWGKKDGATLVGLYQSSSMLETIPLKVVNGIKFSFLAITENVNKDLPADSLPYVISLNEEGKTTAEVYNRVKSLIKKAESMSDIVVVSVHFDGNERSEPTATQQDVVNYLASFGADVIIGSGTNSVQPIEFRENSDGSQTLIAYSLGNFVSAQTAKENMLGAIADIVFVKDNESGKTAIKTAKIIPVVTMYGPNYTNVKVMPLSSLDAETADAHGIYGFNLPFAETYFKEVIGEENLELKVTDLTEEETDASGETTEAATD